MAELSICDNCDAEIEVSDSVQTNDDQILCEACFTKWSMEHDGSYHG